MAIPGYSRQIAVRPTWYIRMRYLSAGTDTSSVELITGLNLHTTAAWPCQLGLVGAQD